MATDCSFPFTALIQCCIGNDFIFVKNAINWKKNNRQKIIPVIHEHGSRREVGIAMIRVDEH